MTVGRPPLESVLVSLRVHTAVPLEWVFRGSSERVRTQGQKDWSYSSLVRGVPISRWVLFPRRHDPSLPDSARPVRPIHSGLDRRGSEEGPPGVRHSICVKLVDPTDYSSYFGGSGSTGSVYKVPTTEGRWGRSRCSSGCWWGTVPGRFRLIEVTDPDLTKIFRLPDGL